MGLPCPVGGKEGGRAVILGRTGSNGAWGAPQVCPVPPAPGDSGDTGGGLGWGWGRQRMGDSLGWGGTI